MTKIQWQHPPPPPEKLGFTEAGGSARAIQVFLSIKLELVRFSNWGDYIVPLKRHTDSRVTSRNIPNGDCDTDTKSAATDIDRGTKASCCPPSSTWLDWAMSPRTSWRSSSGCSSTDTLRYSVRLFTVALRPQRPYGLLGTWTPGRPSLRSPSSWTQSTAALVQCYCTSSRDRTGSPERPPRISYSSCALRTVFVCSLLLYVHRNHTDR